MTEITVPLCEAFRAIGVQISETDLREFERALFRRGLNIAPLRRTPQPGPFNPQVLPGATNLSEISRAATESRANAMESAIHRFRDCGVELARFSIIDLENGTTHLCVDGMPRFSWRLGWPWNIDAGGGP